MDKSYTCCFSGHRNIPVSEVAWVEQRLDDAVTYLHEQGVTTFLTGGALGFDTIAAEIVLKKRMVYRDIGLIIAIPCKDQAKMWSQKAICCYERLKVAADDVIILSQHYYDGCMAKRNEYMVSQSRYCVCYLTRPYGGTASTVRYAKQNGLIVYNIASKSKGKGHSRK